ncbi:hypothetical protein KFL_003280040 [Klebsormidium nitens]|uniref:Uncharacterized protein n=1 Tax=Klebsormidium nitens TaxID=105231 RepID=A0A1Y1I7X7_KLENI|nr:hypothetical protein KFL_003280040 [Klebsormidium nitens]|eukprot:GAQ87050.1 hypothetical protein KFL_003280040 [Klebsormidium nitens]
MAASLLGFTAIGSLLALLLAAQGAHAAVGNYIPSVPWGCPTVAPEEFVALPLSSLECRYTLNVSASTNGSCWYNASGSYDPSHVSPAVNQTSIGCAGSVNALACPAATGPYYANYPLIVAFLPVRHRSELFLQPIHWGLAVPGGAAHPADVLLLSKPTDTGTPSPFDTRSGATDPPRNPASSPDHSASSSYYPASSRYHPASSSYYPASSSHYPASSPSSHNPASFCYYPASYPWRRET